MDEITIALASLDVDFKTVTILLRPGKVSLLGNSQNIGHSDWHGKIEISSIQELKERNLILLCTKHGTLIIKFATVANLKKWCVK